MNKNGYYYDQNTNTLYMTKAFERKSPQYGSEECKLVLEMKKLFPEMTVEIEVRKAHSKMTYKQMAAFIALLPTAQKDLKEMEARQKMSVAFKSPYKYMERWFNEKYPYHKEYQVKNENGELVWDIAALCHKAEEEAKDRGEIMELPIRKNSDAA